MGQWNHSLGSHVALLWNSFISELISLLIVLLTAAWAGCKAVWVDDGLYHVLLEVLNERRPMIGVVTSSLEPGPTMGTRSVWEKNRLYGSAHTTYLIVQWIPVEVPLFDACNQWKVVNLTFLNAASLVLSLILFFFLWLLWILIHTPFLCITMEKRGKQRRNEREAERIKGLWHRQTAQVN